MQRIGPDGTRLAELAEQAQITKQTAGFLVDQLEKEWREHLGARRMKQLREALTPLREITDPRA